MDRTPSLILLVCLGACTSTVHQPGSWSTAPTFSGSLPRTDAAADDAAPEDKGAPNTTTLPIGVGLTAGPSALMVGATLDFPLDKRITFGPSLQYAIDDDFSLVSLTGQVKYFMEVSTSDSGAFSILPYLTAGVGVAAIDKDGRSSDSGVVINGGAGLRFLTGEHYRIGSEGRINFLPDDLGGESSYWSFELLQVVISF